MPSIGSSTPNGRVAGIVSLAIDGVSFDVMGSCEYSPSYLKRETKMGQSGVFGYSEMPVAGSAKAKIMDAGDLTVSDFNGMSASTVQIQLANGKSVILTNAWQTGELQVSSEDGSFDITFESANVQEV